jgi:hypothetical protein
MLCRLSLPNRTRHVQLGALPIDRTAADNKVGGIGLNIRHFA